MEKRIKALFDNTYCYAECLSSQHNQMNFCLQMINYSESLSLQLCGRLPWEGERAHFIFLIHTPKMETKIQRLVPVPS